MGCCWSKRDAAVAAGDDSQRVCRDLPFLALYCAFWGGCIAIAVVGFRHGDPNALFYGLDYNGHVCGRNNKLDNNWCPTDNCDLRSFKAQYWLNPNQVLQAGSSYGFALADAQSICLPDCPTLLPGNALSCDYPADVSASNWSHPPAAPSLAAWGASGGDYFSLLSPAAVATSCALSGPCYPVLTSQADRWNECQPQTLTNVPLGTTAANALTSCFDCCNQPPPVPAACDAVDATGVRSEFTWAGATGPNASANALVGCLASCEALHGTIASLEADTRASIYPPALALFNATCALATGAPAAAVPSPGVPDGGAMAAVVGALTASYKSTALRYAHDLLGAWKALVVTGLFLPFAMAALWLLIMRYLVGPLVWFTVLCVDVACAGVTLYCFSKAGALNENAFEGIVAYSSSGGFSFNATAVAAAADALAGGSSGSGSAFGNSTVTVATFDVGAVSKREMYDAGIAAAVVTILVWLFTILMIPRLRVAVATVKVAADAVWTVPMLALFPLLPGLALAAFMVWWVAVAAYVYSSGQVQRRDCCAEVQAAFTQLFPTYAPGPPTCDAVHCGYYVKLNTRLEYTLIYWGFAFLATNWIVGFADLVVAQVVHKCYLYGGGAGVALPAWPISRSAYNGVRYHLGSVSLGSLVVAFFQFFRYALAWLAARFKKVGEKEGLVRLLLWLATCLAWFLSWVVDLITGSAYCIIAIDGSGFCAAAATAARLVVANALRLATVAFVGDAIVFLAKLGTAATCAFFCFVYLDHYEEGAISSPLVPVVVCFLTAYAMASVVFSVVEQAITTTLLCLMDDEDRNGGHAKWAPPTLLAATDCVKAYEEEAAERKARTRGCCAGGGADDAPATA